MRFVFSAAQHWCNTGHWLFQALDGRGFTPLLAAAWSMNSAATGALLSAGASVWAEDSSGCNALHLLTARPRDVAPGITVPVDERCADAAHKFLLR